MYRIGDNIISSLGFTSEENFRAAKSGISGIKHYDAGVFDLPEAFMASLIDRERLNDEFLSISSKNIYTDLEKAAILSVFSANIDAKVDLSNERTIFIVSTTKGNVDLLDARRLDTRLLDARLLDARLLDTRQLDARLLDARRLDEKVYKSSVYKSSVYLWHTAKLIADFFGNSNTPIVVVNACISGAAAQVAAMRELQSGRYDYAVVVGVDFLSKFIISGFQSFKALSPELCKPFDKDRCGLNLGEAAATLIMNNEQLTINNGIRLVAGAIRNDATHISAPSRTGEGSFRALKNILQGIDYEQIAFINAHGTATPYNDASEANAIVRAGLKNVPVNSLKAFFGHTLGAAGVLETIISMRAFNDNIVLKSQNFDVQKFEYQINIVQENHISDKKYFVKMMSGFGGCNAVLLFEKAERS